MPHGVRPAYLAPSVGPFPVASRASSPRHMTRRGTPMDKARARELLANERARLERLLRTEMAATAPDQGDDVDDANWRIAEETGRAVSRSLRDRWSALERAEERLERGTYGRSIVSGKGVATEPEEGAEPAAEEDELDVEELEDGEPIDEDEEETPAEFADEELDDELEEEDEEGEEDDDVAAEASDKPEDVEEAEARPPPR